MIIKVTAAWNQGLLSQGWLTGHWQLTKLRWLGLMAVRCEHKSNICIQLHRASTASKGHIYCFILGCSYFHSLDKSVCMHACTGLRYVYFAHSVRQLVGVVHNRSWFESGLWPWVSCQCSVPDNVVCLVCYVVSVAAGKSSLSSAVTEVLLYCQIAKQNFGGVLPNRITCATITEHT